MRGKVAVSGRKPKASPAHRCGPPRLAHGGTGPQASQKVVNGLACKKQLAHPFQHPALCSVHARPETFFQATLKRQGAWEATKSDHDHHRTAGSGGSSLEAG